MDAGERVCGNNAVLGFVSLLMPVLRIDVYFGDAGVGYGAFERGYQSRGFGKLVLGHRGRSGCWEGRRRGRPKEFVWPISSFRVHWGREHNDGDI